MHVMEIHVVVFRVRVRYARAMNIMERHAMQSKGTHGALEDNEYIDKAFRCRKSKANACYGKAYKVKACNGNACKDKTCKGACSILFFVLNTALCLSPKTDCCTIIASSNVISTLSIC
jgi:hypothetical protein